MTFPADRCMELREASNGEELLEVEKRLDREKRKEEAKSAQVAERLRKQTSVFDIINKKLGGKGNALWLNELCHFTQNLFIVVRMKLCMLDSATHIEFWIYLIICMQGKILQYSDSAKWIRINRYYSLNV